MAYLTVLGTMPAYANSSFSRTATPIKHLVVIFQENVSFDHYFGTIQRGESPPPVPKPRGTLVSPEISSRCILSGLHSSSSLKRGVSHE
jgi:phospholipase C